MNENIGIILEGGIGSRMQMAQPKQYLCLNQKEVIAYSIDVFKKTSSLDEFIVVSNDDANQRERISNKYGVDTIIGGTTRNASFRNALDHIEKNFPKCQKIFVNEAARPMITSQIIDDYICLLDNYDYVYSSAPITDSLETISGEYVDRLKYRLVRSPEAYKFHQINVYFSKNSNTTFPGHVLPQSAKGYPYTAYKNNFKLTYQEDIALLEGLLIKYSK